MKSNGDMDWCCAECLRAMNRGEIIVDATDQRSFPLSAYNLMDVLSEYGSKSLKTYYDRQHIPLRAVTMVNNEYRCWVHLER